MSELLEHRVQTSEENLKALKTKVDTLSDHQLESAVKLDHILIAIGELKGQVSKLERRGGMWWDRLVLAVISAVAAAIISRLV